MVSVCAVTVLLAPRATRAVVVHRLRLWTVARSVRLPLIPRSEGIGRARASRSMSLSVAGWVCANARSRSPPTQKRAEGVSGDAAKLRRPLRYVLPRLCVLCR